METVPQYAKGCKFIRQDRTQKTVKKTSRLKRGVYRATYIVRQSRSLGKNQGLPAPEIRGRSERRAFERKNAKICLLMTPSMVAEITKMMPEANATSKTDFVRKAVAFYIGYIRQQKNINYLAPMLAGAIKSEVRSLGKDVCEMLFKLAVEMGINSNITAEVNDIEDESLENIRRNVAQEIARVNGILTFEDANEWQNGGD